MNGKKKRHLASLIYKFTYQAKYECQIKLMYFGS